MRSAVLLALLMAVPSTAALAIAGPGDESAGYADWKCGDNLPYGWVRADIFLTDGVIAGVAVAVHELQHAADAWQAGSCTAYADSIGRVDYRVRTEARAYCQEARFLARAGGMSDAVAFARVATLLSGGVSYQRYFRLTPTQALDAIRGACRTLDYEAAFPSGRRRPPWRATQ